MTILEKELWIKEYYLSLNNEPIKINGEEWEYKELKSCDHIITPTKTYIISNIAQLLQQNIETNGVAIEKTINIIRMKDRCLTNLIKTLDDHDLVWPWKTYQLHNEKVRYSSGTDESPQPDKDGRKTVWPSASFITKDVSSFQPINDKFSKDSSNVYYQYYKVWNHPHGWVDEKPNVATFQAIENSNYWFDSKDIPPHAVFNYVYHWFNYVEWAMIKDGKYEIIKNDSMEVFKDSYNRFFAGHERIKIEHPEQCKHVVDNFFFDGENIYLVCGTAGYNLTEMYNLIWWENIQKISSQEELKTINWFVSENVVNHVKKWSVYKIWDRFFAYDGLIDIKRL